MPQVQGQSAAVPAEVLTPVIAVGATPFAATSFDLSYLLQVCVATSQAHDLPRLEFRRAYGDAMQSWEADFTPDVPPRDIVGQWATLSLLGAGGQSRVFVGKITNEVRKVFGPTANGAPSGWQRWVAYGPFQLLLKATVTSAFYDVNGEAVEGLTQSFNVRDELGTIVGNRSSSIIGTSYVFGGSDLWTRRQVIEYLLNRFTGQDFGGFTWTISGDTGLLDVAADVVEVGRAQSVGSVIRSILSPQFGLDFTVDLYGGGFEIRAFSISLEGATYLGTQVPRNARKITLQASDRVDVVDTTVTRSTDQNYSRILVKGARVVSAFSLRAEDGTLVKKWADADETTYKAGTGASGDSPALHDDARRRIALQSVYQVLGAPDTFKLDDVAASPEINDDGQVVGFGQLHQNTRRRTLNWLPLRENTDYSTEIPADSSPGSHQADLLEPMVFLFDEETERYQLSDRLGVGLSIGGADWGVRLNSEPNHLLAANQFAGANGTEQQPRFDYTKAIATIAVELDTRLQLELTRADGDGTTLEIEVPGAELWCVSPGAVVGTDADGNLITAPSSGVVLRNDRDLLVPVMAAARARYFEERSLATLTMMGLQAWSNVIGHMLTTVERGGVSLDIGAPVTSVTYSAGQQGSAPRTVVRAGYAR